MKKIFTLIFLFLTTPIFAQSEMGERPVVRVAKSSGGSKALIGGGVGPYSTLYPSADLALNQGSMVFIQNEKPFGFFDLGLVAQLCYSHTSGTANYFYSKGDIDYRAQNVGLTIDRFFTGIGIRYKPFEGSFFRPYIEGGTQGGYLQLNYDASLKSPEFAELGDDYKTVEGVLEFGSYAEAGLDMYFQKSSGLKFGGRWSSLSTRQFETLGKREVRYTTSLYFVGYFFQF